MLVIVSEAFICCMFNYAVNFALYTACFISVSIA